MTPAGMKLGTQAANLLAVADCCEIEPGLSDAEFRRIEEEYGFEFADDHRAFLAAGLPVREPPEEGATWESPWPDWRHGDPVSLRKHLEWPIEEVVMAVRHGYWHPGWGQRPAGADDAVRAARATLARVPKLVPVRAHRFLPAGRGSHGHPVLSIWGTDMICYGTDLADYINHEFDDFDAHTPDDWNPRATVAFWQDFL
ncbi:hypothetical protein QWM81_20200 [Streptomyces ficellus]|uniref:SMI1/KNR4 family protein n=1 Tax=Streptomyces ficellus TaxID=1977088 RepID=A0ABT7ZA08_9ACTN|nr:hypothetical protein [Streptomyces ficellus]MDN3296344.1 hypothetical protein [Streptomyces ficellus]